MREKFIEAMKANVEQFGVERTLKIFPQGPSRIVNVILQQARPEHYLMVEWILANREEAERITAGILGLV